MIVVTVGTHEQPFDRLVQAVAGLGGDEELVVQYGTSEVEHGRGTWVDYLSFDELADLAGEARVFVCHAGVGSIVLARRVGLRPVVVPRRHDLGEHVDNHQLSLATRLAVAGVVTMLEDTELLRAVVGEPTTPTAGATAEAGAVPIGTALPGPHELGGTLRSVLSELGAAPLTKRAA
jgi:UDP-N-acetylglucosamine transferase subunit ALG13